MVFTGEVEFDMNPPKNFDPADPYADPIAFIEMRDWIVREKWIEIERAKILGERVKACYRREGVNHLKNCRKWAVAYLEAAKDAGWGRRTEFPARGIKPKLPPEVKEKEKKETEKEEKRVEYA